MCLSQKKWDLAPNRITTSKLKWVPTFAFQSLHFKDGQWGKVLTYHTFLGSRLQYLHGELRKHWLLVPVYFCRCFSIQCHYSHYSSNYWYLHFFGQIVRAENFANGLCCELYHGRKTRYINKSTLHTLSANMRNCECASLKFLRMLFHGRRKDFWSASYIFTPYLH